MGAHHPALLLALLCCIASPLSYAYIEKGASVTLASRWQGTSYLLEAAELLVRASMCPAPISLIATNAHSCIIQTSLECAHQYLCVQAAEDPALFWEFQRVAAEAQDPTNADHCWSHVLTMANRLLPSSITQVSFVLGVYQLQTSNC